MMTTNRHPRPSFLLRPGAAALALGGAILFAAQPGVALAHLKLPSIIGGAMVLQQGQRNPIWGWDDAGTRVTVLFAGQVHTATAGDDGRWEVQLDPLEASSENRTMSIVGTDARQVQDVLVGEVWMCSGQSNMQWSVSQDWKGHLEALTSDLPELRLISVPQVGTQELQDDFNGHWEASTPKTCLDFSAVGFFYGRFLHEALGVPVGLIDNAWGGSAAEAWVRRSTIDEDERFKALVDDWRGREAQFEGPEAEERHREALAQWEQAVADAREKGERPPRRPRAPQDHLAGNQRPGNIFAGVVHPTLGYGIKGVIWYQGESNAGRAAQYADLFPFMIEQWRAEWGQGDFPFYWVQLADFMGEVDEPGDSTWAELRESQSKALELPNTGEAVIIDLGEANDIHPRDKYEVAARLVRWPLARAYGYDLEPQSPTYRTMAVVDGTATLHFDHVDGGLRTLDVNEVRGFAICGEDRQWHWADAEIEGDDRNKIAVSSPAVPEPVAVRYAWADNPVCNVISRQGLPLTPFRTDDFPMITAPEPEEVAGQ